MLCSICSSGTASPTAQCDCGSMSTSSTFLPSPARAAARLIDTVVLPHPPFWFTMATVLIFVSANVPHLSRDIIRNTPSTVPKKPAYQHWQPGKLVLYSLRHGCLQTFSHYMGPAHKRTCRVQKQPPLPAPTGASGPRKSEARNSKSESCRMGFSPCCPRDSNQVKRPRD